MSVASDSVGGRTSSRVIAELNELVEVGEVGGHVWKPKARHGVGRNPTPVFIYDGR